MPSNGGNITFGIDFNVNKSGLNDLKKSLQDVQKMTTKDLVGNLGSSQAKKALEEAKRSAAEVEQALKKAYNPTLGTTNISKFNQELKNSGTNLNQVYQRFSKLGITGQTAFTNLASNILTTNVKLRETHSLLDSMGKTMINTVKWGIASSVMNTFTGSVQNAFNYVKALDSSLTDIRIVTGDSRDQMDRFAKSANQAAQALGRQTKEYTNAALTFYQQGLSDEEVAARTETTLKASNITGADVTSMADQLTAVWNGFQVAGQNTNEVVSKLAAVADSSASNMSELATAMSKSASIANNMGVSVDQLGAQISTIIATTRQAPQTVGNALKTIYARINDIKAGTDQAEVSLGNYTGKMAQLGINVLDQNGQLRDTGQVMEEIGQRWGTMTKEQQVYLAQTMAGQRQMNNLIALFDNWDTYTKQLNISLEAQGTLDQKNARYMESLAAHTKEFEAAQQGLIQSFADSDSFKGFVDLGTEAIRMITLLVEGIGGGGNAILALGSIATSVFSGVISKELNSLITNFQNAKFNAEQLKQVMANTKSVAAIEGITDNKAVTEMVNLQTETQKYYSIMSEAQINHQNDLIKEFGLAQQNLDIWEANKEKAQEYARVISGNSSFKAFEENAQALEAVYIKLDQVDDLIGQVKRSYEAIENINPKFHSLTGASEDLKSLKKYIDDVVKATGATGPAVDRINRAFSILGKQGKLTANEISSVKTAVENFIRTADSRQDHLKQTLDSDGTQADILRNKVDALRGAIESNNSASKQLFDVQSTVKAIGAVGQLASSVLSLSNITKILGDENLNSWEKFLQITMNLGMSLPMLITNLSKVGELAEAFIAKEVATLKQNASTELNTAITEYNTIAKKANAEMQMYGCITEETHTALVMKGNIVHAKRTGLLEAETAAQHGLNVALEANPIIGTIAGIVAFTAALAAALAIMEHFRPSAENAKKSLEKVFNTYNEENEKLSSLKDELKSVQDRIKEIEKLSPITLTDQQELINLKAQNAELQTQIELQEKLVQKSSREVARKANTAVEAKSFQVNTTPFDDGQDFFGNASERYSWGRASIDVSNVSDISNLDITSEEDVQKFLKWQEQMQALVQEANQKIKEAQQSNDKELQQEYTFIRDNLIKDRSGYEQVWKAAHEQALQDLQASHENNVEYIKALQANNQNGMYDDAIEYYQSLQKMYYQLSGTWEDTLLSMMDTIFSSNQIQKIKQYLQQVKGQFDLKDLKGILGEDTFSNLKSAADVLGVSLEELVSGMANLIQQDKTLEQATNDTAIAFEQAKAQAASFSEFKDTLMSGKQLKADDLDDYLGLLTSIGQKYPQLRSQVELLKQTQMSGTQAYKDALEEVGQALEKIKTETAQAAEQDLINQFSESLKNPKYDDKGFEINVSARIDEFQQQLDAIQNADYQTFVSVKADLDSDFDRVLGQMDAISDAASMIGQNFIVAGEDLRELNNAFPGILDGIQYLSDGTAQLAQESVANATAAAGQEVGIQAQKVAEKIKIQQQEFYAKAAAAQKISDLAGQLANSETMSESEKSEKISQINNQLNTLKTTNSKNATDTQIQHLDAQANAADIDSEQGAKSAASMYDSAAKNSEEYANQAITNISAVTAAMGGAEGGSGSYSPIKPHYTKSGGGIAAGSVQLDTFEAEQFSADTTGEQWQAISDKYAALAQSYLDAAHDMDGQLAELSAGVSDIADRVGNAAAGKGGTNTKSGKGGGGGGGGGGKDKTKSAEEIDKLKLKDQDVDKYHQIERAIKRIDDYLDEMSGYEEKAIRQGKSDTIDKEVDALEQQKALYEQKIQMMQADLQLQQADLALLGVQFDEQGNIINYTALMSAYQAQYNALLEQAKLLTGDAQENKLKQASNLKQQLESLKSQMGAYEALQDKIVDAGAAIRDIIDKEEELRIKQFKIKIDTELEFADAKRDWNEFKKEVIDKIKDDDFLGQARARVQDFFSYYDDQGNGIIQQLTEHVNRTREQAEIIENGGTSSIYGKNQAQALEDLKNYTDELMQNLKDVQEIAKDIHDLYLDTIDKAQDAFDEQIDQYEQIDGIIEHDMNLLQLLSPQNNEEQLAHYYDQRAKNHNQEIDFYRREADMWKVQMENAEQGTEEWKKFRDNWESSINDLNSAVESAVENLLDKYQNTISKIIKDTKNQIMGGDWQKAMDEWDRAQWQDDRYLDMGSRATGVLDFVDKVNEAMDKQSPKVQKQLNDFLKKEVDYLNQIPNLRQVDLDIAYKKLEVLQKQMALEDAQEAKTRLRLRRDSQGNYTYQYVSDEDDIATKQQQLRDTLEELRQLAKVDISDTMDEVEERLNEFFERAQELSQTYYNDQDLLQQKLLELQNEYFGEEGYITLLGMDYHTMQEQLLVATGAQFSELLIQEGDALAEFLGLTQINTNETQAKIWESILALMNPDGGQIPTLFDAFVSDVFQKNLALMSEEHQNLLFGSETGLNPTWNTALGNMAQNYIVLTRDIVLPCMQAMVNANGVYMQDLANLQQVAGVVFSDIAQGIDVDIAYTQGLIQVNDYLVDTFNNEINAIAGVCAQIANLCAQYSAAEQAAIDAANASLKFWFAANGQTIGDVYSGGTPHATAAVPPSTPVNGGASSGGSSGGNSSGGRSTQTSTTSKPNEYFMVKGANGEAVYYQYAGNGDFSASPINRVSAQTASQGTIIDRNTYAVRGDSGSHVEGLDSSVYKYDYNRNRKVKTTGGSILAFATGGYTGEWTGGSQNGRIALLHQKELVLNPEDTVNMLNAVKIASGMMQHVFGVNGSLLDRLNSNRSISNITNTNSTDASMSQNIVINADFPNANSASEIRQAFNNLINIATMKANQK